MVTYGLYNIYLLAHNSHNIKLTPTKFVITPSHGGWGRDSDVNLQKEKWLWKKTNYKLTVAVGGAVYCHCQVPHPLIVVIVLPSLLSLWSLSPPPCTLSSCHCSFLSLSPPPVTSLPPHYVTLTLHPARRGSQRWWQWCPWWSCPPIVVSTLKKLVDEKN